MYGKFLSFVEKALELERQMSREEERGVGRGSVIRTGFSVSIVQPYVGRWEEKYE